MELAGLVERIGELEPQLEAFGRLLRKQRSRPFEEVDSRRSVAAGDRPPTGGCELPAATHRQAATDVVHPLHLRAVTESLLQVVAEHLLDLRLADARR